jgi:hypothetical protein
VRSLISFQVLLILAADAYAVYPRQLRYMSKEELFGSPLACRLEGRQRLPSLASSKPRLPN